MVIQICSSTTDGEEIEVEQFCGELQQFVDTRSKKDIKLEDWNDTAGSKITSGIMRKFALV